MDGEPVQDSIGYDLEVSETSRYLRFPVLTVAVIGTVLGLVASAFVVTETANAYLGAKVIKQYHPENRTRWCDCGPASVAMAVDYLGSRPADLSDGALVWDARLKTGDLGQCTNSDRTANTVASQLRNALDAYEGITGEVVNTLDAVKEASTEGWPIITLLDTSKLGRNIGYHWVLVTGFSGDRVGFNDPLPRSGTDGHDEVSLSSFSAAFGDSAVVARRRAATPPRLPTSSPTPSPTPIVLAAVDDLIVVPTSQAEVALSWTPVTGADGYEVHRQNPDGSSAVVSPRTASTTLTDGGLVCGNNYSYVVRPFRGASNGPISNMATVTTHCPQPTPASKSDDLAIPGGRWVGPPNSTIVSDRIPFAAQAYDDRGGSGVNRVEFTVWWPSLGPKSGPWLKACVLERPTYGDVYQCAWNPASEGAPVGSLTISFDVYDNAGNKNLSPNGERTIQYVPTGSTPPSMPVATAIPVSTPTASPTRSPAPPYLSPSPAIPENGAILPEGADVTLVWTSALATLGDPEFKVELWGGHYSLMTPCDWSRSGICRIGQMRPGGPYFWHVKARNSTLETDWSATSMFTIGGADPTPTPSSLAIAIVSVSPQGENVPRGKLLTGSFVVRTSGFNFGPNCSEYEGRFQIINVDTKNAENAGCTDLGGNQYRFTVFITAATAPGTYHRRYQLRSMTSNVTSEVIDLWYVIPAPPPAPSLSSPPDGTTVPSNIGENAKPLSISWSTISGAQCYDVQLAADSAFATLLNDGSHYSESGPHAPTVCSFGIPNNNGVVRSSSASVVGIEQWSDTRVQAPLGGGATYYWRVRVRATGSSLSNAVFNPSSWSASRSIRVSGASLTLSPTSGPPGTIVTVNGTGFASNEAGIQLFLDNAGSTSLGTATADSSGRFVVSVAIAPSTPARAHPILAIGPTSATFAVFEVTSASAVSPSPSPTLTSTPSSTPSPTATQSLSTATPTATATPSATVIPTSTPTPTATASSSSNPP